MLFCKSILYLLHRLQIGTGRQLKPYCSYYGSEMQLYTCLLGRLCVTLRRLEDVQRQLLLQLLTVDIPQAAVADVGGEVGEGWAWGLRPVARRTSSDRRTTRQPRLHHLARHPAAVRHLLRPYNIVSPSLVIEQRINVSRIFYGI